MKFFKHMKSSTLLLLVGILLFTIDFFINMDYEDARAKGYEIEATITRIDVRESNDAGMDDIYVAYGEYEVDGRTYTNKRLGHCGEDDYVGGKMTVVVDPDDPGDTEFEGGVLAVVGFIMMIVALIWKYKDRKAAKQAAQA
ncbi:MAG: hypothetical protein E7467_08935 [Ruminococcaceae bacterium]|nr:hypothetical protein [Oscillospiraceae bacterium]